jgi:hypothetical protein
MTEVIESRSGALEHERQAVLIRTLARAGWHMDFVDLDLVGGRAAATIRCHRSDGRWVWAQLDAHGRCSISTFQRESWLGKPSNTKGRWPISPQVDDLFLGRMRATGPRAMLRQLTHYLVDNATSPIELTDMRSAWAAVMASPLMLRSAPASAAAE